MMAENNRMCKWDRHAWWHCCKIKIYVVHALHCSQRRCLVFLPFARLTRLQRMISILLLKLGDPGINYLHKSQVMESDYRCAHLADRSPATRVRARALLNSKQLRHFKCQRRCEQHATSKPLDLLQGVWQVGVGFLNAHCLQGWQGLQQLRLPKEKLRHLPCCRKEWHSLRLLTR